MNRKLLAATAAVAGAMSLSACSYNEALGRNQLLLVNNSSLAAAGTQAWAQTLSQSRVSTDPAANQRVRAVGSRMVQAAGLGGQPWEYAVFENNTPNAFALPGGKIGVNTGLLRLVANDDQLAAVIGHEVAHSVANHAAERMSQQAAAQIGLGVASSALGGRVAAVPEVFGGFIGESLSFVLKVGRPRHRRRFLAATPREATRMPAASDSGTPLRRGAACQQP